MKNNMMIKITNSEDSFVSREYLDSNRLGIIFPNSASGHFLYTFYSYDHELTMHTSSIDRLGTAHRQTRKHFNTYSDFETSQLHFDKKHIISSKKDFLAHYWDYAEVKNQFPDHFLIGIKISPELLLLHTYMMVFKVTKSVSVEKFKRITRQPIDVHYQTYENFYNHFNNYRYCDLDLMYTTKELYYDKTVNPRLKEYRSYQKQYVDRYIDFFANFQQCMSSDFRYQYKFEKEFMEKHRDTLDI